MPSLDPAADELRRRATHLRRTAFILDDLELWSLAGRADERTWIGPAATEFVDTLAGAGRDVTAGRDELIRAATRLERTADELDRRARAQLTPGPPAGPAGPAGQGGGSGLR